MQVISLFWTFDDDTMDYEVFFATNVDKYGQKKAKEQWKLLLPGEEDSSGVDFG